jgi:acid phosphatase
VYHGLLKFLPAQHEDWSSKVKYRVTNNIITSQVAGMVIKGMWNTNKPIPVQVQVRAQLPSCVQPSKARDGIC